MRSNPAHAKKKFPTCDKINNLIITLKYNMDDYIQAYEYEKNVNPPLTSIPIIQKNIKDCHYGFTFIDFSELFNVDHICTSPNLLASFIKIK